MISRRTIKQTILFLALFILIVSVNIAYAGGGGGNAETNQLWVGQYFNNTERAGSPVFTRIDNDLEFDWGTDAPSYVLPSDNFSVRWTSNATLSGGTYRFWTRSDDQIRILVDGTEVIDTFETNVVDQLVTGDIVLGAGQHNMVVEYREFVGPAFVFVDYANISRGETGPDFENTTQPQAQVGDWTVNYYSNSNLQGSPVAIFGGQEPISNWGYGSPTPVLPVDEWSARWTSTQLFNGNTYIFYAQADDGVRVYLDGQLIIDEWHSATGTTYTAARSLTAGFHSLIVEYYESGGTASVNFGYELSPNNISAPAPTTPTTNTPTNTTQDYIGTVTISTPRLNVRDEPSPFTGEILTRVSLGEEYRVLAFNQSETWVQISANGYTGWVNAGYVSYNNPENNTRTSEYTVTAAPYTVNIRTGPGTQFDDISNFENGDSARVIGRNADSTWWQINYNGIVGWVSARYARIQSWADIDSIPVTG